jgi:hypothetical protein
MSHPIGGCRRKGNGVRAWTSPRGPHWVLRRRARVPTGAPMRGDSAPEVRGRRASSCRPQIPAIHLHLLRLAQLQPVGGYAEHILASPGTAVALMSSVAALMIGKDYELSREMLDHYLTADGDPLIYSPPQAVQDAIKKKFPSPGHFVEVSGFGSWATPDIRNGLGHFNLDVVKTDEGLMYFVTDRYEFPDKANGVIVRHGFQVGKLSKSSIDSLNAKLSMFGEYKRDSGSLTEKFDLQRDPKTGECTLMIPQKVLMDNGTNFDSMGTFSVPAPSGKSAH